MATLKYNSLTTHSCSWQDYYICAPREMARQTEQPPQVCRGAWIKLPPSHLLLKFKDPNAVDFANSKVNASALPVTTYIAMVADFAKVLHMMNSQHDGLPISTLRWLSLTWHQLTSQRLPKCLQVLKPCHGIGHRQPAAIICVLCSITMSTTRLVVLPSPSPPQPWWCTDNQSSK